MSSVGRGASGTGSGSAPNAFSATARPQPLSINVNTVLLRGNPLGILSSTGSGAAKASSSFSSRRHSDVVREPIDDRGEGTSLRRPWLHAGVGATEERLLAAQRTEVRQIYGTATFGATQSNGSEEASTGGEGGRDGDVGRRRQEVPLRNAEGSVVTLPRQQQQFLKQIRKSGSQDKHIHNDRREAKRPRDVSEPLHSAARNSLTQTGDDERKNKNEQAMENGEWMMEKKEVGLGRTSANRKQSLAQRLHDTLHNERRGKRMR